MKRFTIDVGPARYTFLFDGEGVRTKGEAPLQADSSKTVDGYTIPPGDSRAGYGDPPPMHVEVEDA